MFMMYTCLISVIWRQLLHCMLILQYYSFKVSFSLSLSLSASLPLSLCLSSPSSLSDWSTLSVYSYHSELVHDIIESDDDKYDDEDDSNGK